MFPHRRTRQFRSLALAGLLLGLGQWARPEEPPATLDARYGPEIRKVRATPATGDDVELAQRILADADTGANPPELTAAMCREAYDLASQSPAGYDPAVEAMETLAELVPGTRGESLEKIFVMTEKLYRHQQGPDRTLTGRHLIRVLLALSSVKALGGEGDIADLYLRQAVPIAQSLRSEVDTRRIREALQSLPDRVALGRKIRQLRTDIKLDPARTEARKELIRLYVVELDDPAAGAALLAGDLDEALRSYLPLAARGPEGMPADVAMEVATWLETLADDTPKARQTALRRRARRFYRYALLALPEGEPLRDQADQAIRKIDADPDASGAKGTDWSVQAAGLYLAADDPTRRAAGLARDYLLIRQQPDGTWLPEQPNPNGFTRSGLTALATYALLASGQRPTAPPMRKALAALRREPADDTLALAFRCCTWSACRNARTLRYDRLLLSDATALWRATVNGSFDEEAQPGPKPQRGDAFHTWYAVLGLASASAGGAETPHDVWARNESWWRRSQNRDGGWGFRPGRLSRHEYTVAGAAALLMDLNYLGQSRAEALEDRNVQAALKWIDSRYDDGKNQNPLHYLYALTRLGVARGTREFRGKDWFAWVAADLLRHQGQDGAWRPRRCNPDVSTALGLLILSYACQME